MLVPVRDTIDTLRAELTRRPSYHLTELFTPDPATGEYTLHVEDRHSDGTPAGRVDLRVRWIRGSPQNAAGQILVTLSDPFGHISPARWRRRPTPIAEITMLADEWLIAMRATATHRRAIEDAEVAIHNRLRAAAERLAPTGLKSTRRGPMAIDCDILLRPKTLADTQQVLDVLTDEERIRARVTIWVRLDYVAPDRVVALVAAADPYLKPVASAAYATSTTYSRRRRPRARART